MKKLFFPLVAVVGLTAMSFTKANTKPVSAQEVSVQSLMDMDAEGASVATKHLRMDFFTEHIYNVMETESGVKMDNVLSKY